MNNTVPQGISQRPIKFNSADVDHETLVNETALLTLGDFEPLSFKIDTNRFMQEISAFQNEWVDYLPRPGAYNNRRALAVTNLPGLTHRDNPSQAQACVAQGRYVQETEFYHPTDVYKRCESLWPLLNTFPFLGRSFLVNCGVGGYFMPHRDHPSMPRETFRIAVFLNNCAPMQYDWLIDTDRKLPIEMGRAYYINTRKTHRTMSWTADSIHLIINVPFNSENVSKVFENLQHRH